MENYVGLVDGQPHFGSEIAGILRHALDVGLGLDATKSLFHVCVLYVLVNCDLISINNGRGHLTIFSQKSRRN